VIHQVYALHFGDKNGTRGEFMYRDASRDPLTISFYIWVVLGGREPIVLDAGFDAVQAAGRNVVNYTDRAELLGRVGLAPDDVKTVVVSHLHWDHWAGYSLFRNASFIMQQAELDFWKVRGSRASLITQSANMAALKAVADLEGTGRIRKLDGRRIELWPGLHIVPLPGHTPGLQALLIETERGPVMLASDALHFLENYTQRTPVQVTMNFPEALDAYDTIAALVGDDVVGGHDPADAARFPHIAPDVYRIA
jgi:glyoxylase-like metal-dependent hydrolase (beta-lactamase superfamily II)